VVNYIHYTILMTTMERHRNWKISVYGREHGVPHVHVTGPGFRATVVIATGDVLVGTAPSHVLADVRNWLDSHRTDAFAQWIMHNLTWGE